MSVSEKQWKSWGHEPGKKKVTTCKCKALRTTGAVNFPFRRRDGFTIVTPDGTEHARDRCVKADVVPKGFKERLVDG